MEIHRLYADVVRNEGKENGDWAEYVVPNFNGGIHVSFVGVIQNINTEGGYIGTGVGGNGNEVQISYHEKGARRDFFTVRQGYVEQMLTCDTALELVVRYQVQELGYIEVRTFEPCKHEISN